MAAVKRFTAELYQGHSDRAVIVPFDPAEVWGVTLGVHFCQGSAFTT